MTREHYINIRNENKVTDMFLYDYYLENKKKENKTIPYDDFFVNLQIWLFSRQQSIEGLIDKIIKEYDSEYNVITLIDNKTNQVIKYY